MDSISTKSNEAILIVALSNGKLVANFSSPHEFKFEDGSYLNAVSAEKAEKLAVKFIEDINPFNGDVSLRFELTEEIIEEMEFWQNLKNKGHVDVVFCPLPMIVAIKEKFGMGEEWLLQSPFRSVRIENRIEKLVSISKQCI
jgi:hypothetical protein